MVTPEQLLQVVREIRDFEAREEEAAYWEWHYTEGAILTDPSKEPT